MTENIARLKRIDGTVVAEIPLPRSAAEVPLSRYVSFLVEMKKFGLEDVNPIQVMAQAVGEATGVGLGEILQAKVGEQWEQHKELDGGVRSLYGWIVNALTNYKGQARTPDNFSFQYNGETFKIPYIVAAELAGGLPVLPEVETAEAVEAFETIRGFNQQIKDAGDPKGERAKRIKQLKEAITKSGDKDGEMMREINRLEVEIDLDGDPNGNLMFAQYLRVIAILARKEGERLPANDGDRERWIQNRMIYFQGIDTKTALDVDFFLIGLLIHSKRTHPVIGSLIPPLFALAAAIQSKPQPKGRHIKGLSVIKKKSKNGLVGVRSSVRLSKGAGLIIPK